MDPKRIAILGVVALIFLFSMELSSFGGYTIPILLITGMIFYFLFGKISQMMSNGSSYFMIALMIIISAIILMMAYGLNAILQNKKEINSQWPDYKCKPYVMPFAGVMVGPGNTNPASNFMDCMWDINKSFFQILISPFVQMIELIVGILNGLTGDIQNIRKMLSYLRDNVREVLEDIYQRLYDTYARIAFIVKKVMQIFGKLFDVFNSTFDVLTYAFYTLASIWNGPIGSTAESIGKVSKFFCFSGDFRVEMKGGVAKKIKYIEVGDILSHGNGVYGIIIFTGKWTPLMNYRGILVSGEHLVQIKGVWKRVEDAVKDLQQEQNEKSAKNINTTLNYHEPFIYCLLTTEGVIRSARSKLVLDSEYKLESPSNSPSNSFIDSHIIEPITFSDYAETTSREHNVMIYRTILEYINYDIPDYNSPRIISRKEVDYQWGFCRDTLVRMSDGIWKEITSINIGDKIKGGGEVLAKIKMLPGRMYLYRGILVSGAMIAQSRGGIWWPVYLLDGAERMNYEGIIYNLITEKNIIVAGDDVHFRDFEQCGDKDLNEIIDRLTLTQINGYYKGNFESDEDSSKVILESINETKSKKKSDSKSSKTDSKSSKTSSKSDSNSKSDSKSDKELEKEPLIGYSYSDK